MRLQKGLHVSCHIHHYWLPGYKRMWYQVKLKACTHMEVGFTTIVCWNVQCNSLMPEILGWETALSISTLKYGRYIACYQTNPCRRSLPDTSRLGSSTGWRRGSSLFFQFCWTLMSPLGNVSNLRWRPLTIYRSSEEQSFSRYYVCCWQRQVIHFSAAVPHLLSFAYKSPPT